MDKSGDTPVAVKTDSLKQADQRAFVQRHLQTNRLHLYVTSIGLQSGKTYLHQASVSQEVMDGDFFGATPPTLSLSLQGAQDVMEALWYAGVRPANVGNPGELAQVQKQVENMQSFADYLAKQNEKLVDILGQSLESVLGATK